MLYRRLAWLCVALSGFAAGALADAPPPLKIHLISGSKEYRSEPSLKAFKEHLESHLRAEVSASWVSDGAKALPGIESVPEADLLIIFARRLKLPEEPMDVLRKHWQRGKPIIGVRTASHAFSREDNAVFDRKVLGGNYQGHFGSQPVRVEATEAGKKHPVLEGVESMTSRKLYKAGPLAESATVLQRGSIEGGQTHAVTWVNEHAGGRMFYTSLGVPEDFENDSFRRMLVNAILWTTGREAKSLRKPEPGESGPQSQDTPERDAARAGEDALQSQGANPSGYRLALLLGNFEYEGVRLQGVEASLEVVDAALQSRGFRTTRRDNLAQEALEEAVEEFARSVPTNGVAVIYYAGLGAHLERQGRLYNLLRPVGADIGDENDYRSRALAVHELSETLRERSGARVSMIFLDACWESPIQPDRDALRGGLRGYEVGEDTVVVFAAGSEKTLPAPEGDEPSALARALARHAGMLDDSVKRACEAIAAQLGGAWFGGASERGLGAPPSRPVVPTLREGATPGEGYINSIGMTFRWCPPGSFTMGSRDAATAATRDREPVPVTLSRGFWMGEHEVTQREYDIVRGRDVPPGFTRHRNAPFWGAGEAKQVTDFCERLSKLEREAGALPDGWEYVCPTEAEWEYACRAGSATAYCFGDSVAELGAYGNFADHSLHAENPNYHWAHRAADDGVGEALAPVGSYRPNAWGLRDMHGNVAELVADHLLPELPGGTDPLARVKKDGQTQIRGGAWCSLPLYCQSSFRNALPGRDKRDFAGFRVALKKVK